ncbi:MAG: MFS transporter, partial [Holophaga sp.]|nr:MFS transporter [Holophaga sp.]
MSSGKGHDAYASLRFPEYRWFLGGLFAFTVATQIQTLAMAWQVYHITHDPLSLGLIGLAEAIPFLALTLVGGWAADRRDRRTLSLLSMAVMLTGGLLLLAMNT